MMFLICDKRKSSLLFHAICFLLHASCFSIYATVHESFVSFLLLLAIDLWEGLPLSWGAPSRQLSSFDFALFRVHLQLPLLAAGVVIFLQCSWSNLLKGLLDLLPGWFLNWLGTKGMGVWSKVWGAWGECSWCLRDKLEHRGVHS
jgi:hypothetical protein